MTEKYLEALQQKEAKAKQLEEEKLAKRARRAEKHKTNEKPKLGRRGRPKKVQTEL